MTGFLAIGHGQAIILKEHADSEFVIVQIVALLATGLGLVQMTPKHRERAFRKLQRLGAFPVILTGPVLICVVSLFTYSRCTREGALRRGGAQRRTVSWPGRSLLPMALRAVAAVR
jgi:hypothetical protein